MSVHGRAKVMGVLNVTPDSFYEPSRATGDRAVARGRDLIAEGAAILDVGGESTRPGAVPVAEAEELDRVVPVIEALAGACRLSVDTRTPEVARRAVAAGATLLNDVGGALAPVASEMGVGWVAMHHRGIPAGTEHVASVPGLCAEVRRDVMRSARAAAALGVEEIYVDPGIGFGKDVEGNLRLVAHLDELCADAHDEGFGVLIGASRKRFLGALPHGGALGAEDRLEGSLAVAVYAMACGVDIVRVHDVAASVQAATLVADEEDAA